MINDISDQLNTATCIGATKINMRNRYAVLDLGLEVNLEFLVILGRKSKIRPGYHTRLHLRLKLYCQKFQSFHQ